MAGAALIAATADAVLNGSHGNHQRMAVSNKRMAVRKELGAPGGCRVTFGSWRTSGRCHIVSREVPCSKQGGAM